jgi:hypothetical protein
MQHEDTNKQLYNFYGRKVTFHVGLQLLRKTTFLEILQLGNGMTVPDYGERILGANLKECSLNWMQADTNAFAIFSSPKAESCHHCLPDCQKVEYKTEIRQVLD